MRHGPLADYGFRAVIAPSTLTSSSELLSKWLTSVVLQRPRSRSCFAGPRRDGGL